MKRSITGVLLISGLTLFWSGELMAQNSSQGHHRPQMEEGKRLEKLQQELSLTNDQLAKLEMLNKANKETIMSIRNDESLDRQTKIEMMREVRQEREDTLKDLFSPEQYEQYTALQQQNQQKKPRRQSSKGNRTKDLK